MTHVKARTSPYIGGTERTSVPDDKVPWKTKWSEYKPVEYTADVVLKQPVWADPVDPKKITKFNQIDGHTDRTSLTGQYDIDRDSGRPLNPRGRTGMSGRGLLGRWGPNHAADPVVTRWSTRDINGKRILEVVGIKRKDTGELALPGGMVDAGEKISVAAKREFLEEAVNDPAAKKRVDEFFAHQRPIWAGYVDDPRNTDNAWMESEAVNVHDEDGKYTKDFKLSAGDDATHVKWYAIDRDLKFYASHEEIVRKAVELHGAYEYWKPSPADKKGAVGGTNDGSSKSTASARAGH